MKCEKCAFYSECQRAGVELEMCRDFDLSDEARREEREAYEVDKADAKRKGDL